MIHSPTRSRFSRLPAALAILLAAALVPFEHGPQALAQPASAIGEPLTSPQLAPGTVSVRVIAGSTSSPVTGSDVTLLVDNVPRVMRTDGSGRAIFTGVPINAKVQAKILDSEKKDILSKQFTVPDQGGTQLMLSTKPFAGNMGGGNAAAMQAMGMPSGRTASGKPQFDAEHPGGTYQVRLTYDNLSMQGGVPMDTAPPTGQKVTLVGYAHDNAVVAMQQPVDAKGLARFEKLDVSGGTVYYALATLPRNNAHDRMMSMPVSPVSQGGSKVILSGDKRDATSKPIDDLATSAAIPTPAGKVRITLDGAVREASPIRLVDAVTKLELGRIVPTRPPPNPSNIESASQYSPNTTAPGTLGIEIHGGAGAVDKPLPEIAIRIIPVTVPSEHAPGEDGKAVPPGSVIDTTGTPVGAGSAAAGSASSPVPAAAGSAAPAGTTTAPTGSSTPIEPAGSGSAGSATPAQATNQQHGNANNASPAPAGAGSAAPPVAQEGPSTPAKTGADGTVSVTLAPGQYKVVYTINGKEFSTTPFDLSKQGGTLEAVAQWEGEGRLEALFDLVPRPDQVLYAETTNQGTLFRTVPFMPVPTTGTHVSIVVYPPALVNFSLRALMDDEQLAVRGTFSIEHRSWIPYRDTPDGMIIPLPRGFKGAVVAPESQNDVTVAPGEGFRIVRPIPPGGLKFVGGFSLDADGGDVRWALDLPRGTFNSGIEIRKAEGMTVKGLPPGTKSRVAQAENGTEWIVVYPIAIQPNKSMHMTIAGVPSHPSWKKWVPRIVGVGVFMLILGGIAWGVLFRKPAPAVDGNARKQALLDELVELERSGGDPARKEALVAELERLWK